MGKVVLGLANIYMGPVGGNGGMGTALEKVGNTVPGTAQLNTEDDQTTDFFIEEASGAIESFVSQEGATTLQWESSDVSPYQLQKFFGGTLNQAKTIATLGTITGGSSYTNGTYYDVPLTGGAGVGATADITVAGGAVTVVTIRNGGEGYAAANVLSAAAANIGGTGNGFSVPVATLNNAAATASTWQAPASNITLTRSLKVETKKGWTLNIPKAQISARFNASFTKDALSKISISAKVLVPDNPSVGRYEVVANI